MPEQIDSVPELFGREPELGALRALLCDEPCPEAVLMTGPPGVGKTALLAAGVALARSAGRRVALARPNDAEVGMAFAGLIDLCDGIGPRMLAEVPSPQRSALEVALLRADPREGMKPDPHAVGLGFLNVLRALAAAAPVVIAVDDLPWLDAPSLDALVFAARRLHGEPVSFLLTRRAGQPTDLERVLRPERIELGGLGPEAVRRLLAARLGLFPPRVMLRRIVEISQGNALFALEIGRTIWAAGSSRSEDMVLPSTVENALAGRVRGLAPGVRSVLLAVALSEGLRRAEIDAICGREDVDAALDEGVLIVEGSRVRASHPLFASAAVGNATRAQRRQSHRAIGAVVADAELRALHLARASDHPDPDLAGRVAEAASRAAARGARPQAVILAEHALRLTPDDAAETGQRVLTLAGYLNASGDVSRMTGLLQSSLQQLPAGSLRARGWLMLSQGSDVTTFEEYLDRLDRALIEAADDPLIRADAIARKAAATAAIAVRGVAEADRALREALDELDGGSSTEARLLYSLSWTTALSGRQVDDVCARFRSTFSGSTSLAVDPERVAVERMVWRGDLRAARELLTGLLDRADEQGEGESYALLRMQLCELELRAGDWDRAARLLEEWAESAERDLLNLPMYERCRALLCAGRGEAVEARRWAAEAIARADASGDGWDRLEAQRARGMAALLEQDPDAAVDDLRSVWQHLEREGVGDPGAFPVVPELVEALIEVGEVAEAEAITDTLRRRSENQTHPWGAVTFRRCRALVHLADRFDETGSRSLAAAADDLKDLGLRFDSARCRLAFGRAARRARRWGAARASLEQAAAEFDRTGASGWAARARTELARVGGRSPAESGTLTVTEGQVVELAALGLTNKEIARRLSMAVHTVEVHLSRAYGKLGVRSRSQLVARLGAGPNR